MAANAARGVVRRGFGFGSLRNMSPERRRRFVSVVLRERPSAVGSADVPADQEVLDAIHERGFARLPFRLSDAAVKRAKDFFARREHFAAQVYAQSDRMPIHRDWNAYGNPAPHRYICFRRQDTVEFLSGSEWCESANRDLRSLKSLADRYCGFDTHLYGANTFGTLPGKGSGYAMRMHRDYDDFNFLTIFIAWTKTSAEDGATLYVPTSHRTSDVEVRAIALEADAGEIYAVDTFGLHAGNSKVLQARLATWLRFGHAVNLATVQDGD